MDKFDHYLDINEKLDLDAFKIHDVMFTYRDLIQSLMYISPYCYSVVQNKYNPGGVNSFMITINTEDEVLMCTPGKTSKYRMANTHIRVNSVMEHQDTKVLTFIFSTGFLFDVFEFKKPKLENDGRYILEETGDLILFRDDLEAMMEVKC